MNPLSKLQSEAVAKFRRNVSYDGAETGCNWEMEDVEIFIQDQIDKAYSKGREEERKKFNKYCENCVLYETKQLLSIQSKGKMK